MNHTKFDHTRVIEWELICDFYEDRVANRSRVPLINHIREGLFVLDEINASTKAKRAFMIHPLLQADDDLKAHFTDICTKVDPYVIGLALEYRNIANAYLSNNSISVWEDIKLSPLDEVNDMLIADKVQNAKDFYLYHHGRIANSNRLVQYFDEWHKRLGISKDQYLEFEIRLKEMVHT